MIGIIFGEFGEYNYTIVDPKYYIERIHWQAAECGAKAREPIINGRARYRMHCHREESIHGAHVNEIDSAKH